MRARLKDGMVILSTESDADRTAFAVWRDAARGHVFAFDGGGEKGGALHDIGLQEVACREPLNILFEQGDPAWWPISNLARTPFVLRGQAYASVEGFWQGLKFDAADERRRVGALWGKAAKHAAAGRPARPEIDYAGATHAVGGPGHHGLMRDACRAKFTQHLEAREALLTTGERPLTHRTRRDSRTIPGALMADIWMRLRDTLRRTAAPPDD